MSATNIYIRWAAALFLALIVAGCANPYERSPEQGISSAVAYRKPKPSTLVTGNYCGVGTVYHYGQSVFFASRFGVLVLQFVLGFEYLLLPLFRFYGRT